MAIVTLYQATDMTYSPLYSSFNTNSLSLVTNPTTGTSSATDYTVTYPDGIVDRYWGNYHWSSVSSGGVASGTVTSYTSYNSSGIVAKTIVGLSLDFLTTANTITSSPYSTTALQYMLSGNDTIYGSTFNDTLYGYAGNDTMIGSLGDDTYVVDDALDVVTEALDEGTDTVKVNIVNAGTYTLPENVENGTLTNTGAFILIGNGLGNTLTGNANTNMLDGAAGVDILVGGLGDDGYVVDLIVDVGGNLAVLQDTVIEDVIIGSKDAIVLATRDAIGNVIDLGLLTASTIYLPDNVEGLAANNTAFNKLNLTGNVSDNWITGNDYDNVIDGSAGADLMVGSKGNDTYIVDNTGDIVDETDTFLSFFSLGAGVDTTGIDSAQVKIANVGGSYTLTNHVENGILTNTVAFDLTGNDLDNNLTGNAAANVITDDLGSDTLNGGDGNDLLDGGSDSDTLYGGSDSDTLYGGSDSDTLYGGSDSDTLYGGWGNDILDGGLGADIMIGGLDNDTYVVDSSLDVVTETSTLLSGIDTVQASITYTLGANIENLTLTGTTAINGTGNSLNNTLTGNAAANILDGDIGDDTMIGGDGNDTYIVNSSLDVVTETSTLISEIDTVQASIAYILGTNVENLTLTGTTAINGTGNSLNNTLIGNTAANILAGGQGRDIMNGQGGDDTYLVDDALDVVTEAFLDGTDTVQVNIASVGGTYAFTNNVENGTLTNTVAYNLTGNNLANTLTGNDATNILDGGLSGDIMNGRDGDDIYLVDDALDLVTESFNAGIDTVRVNIGTLSGNYTLSNNFENGTLTNTVAYNLTGNALNNTLTGNAAANVLNGLTGADAMTGGNGNDIYYVDNIGDVISETNAVTATGGIDTIRTEISYTLGANLEQMRLLGVTAINGTGNTLNNTLTGNVSANVLNGLTGADAMTGGNGNDIYYVDNIGDVISETNAVTATGGFDIVRSEISYTLGTNLEQMRLLGVTAINGTGNTLNNTLTGNVSANVLNGLTGADTMTGGDGNDIYYVDNIGDVISETNAVTATGGFDIVRSEISYTLGTNLEQLKLLGATAINGTGNSLNNTLTGNAAANVLNGLTGADTMTGGDGNDIYYVDNIGDVISETNAVTATGGFDIVRSEISYTLGTNLEQLKLLGATAINGTGNSLNNTLLGNAANNILTGGTGTDTMTGGLGADTFDFNAILDSLTGTARDVITDFSSAQLDKIDLSEIDAISSTGINDAFSYIGTGAFTSTAGELRFASGIVSGDVNGDGVSDFELGLTGVTSMVGADFVF